MISRRAAAISAFCARLLIQQIQQRKAKLVSHEIKVCRNDEEKILEYLTPHAMRLAQNWHPITLADRNASEDRSESEAEIE